MNTLLRQYTSQPFGVITHLPSSLLQSTMGGTLAAQQSRYSLIVTSSQREASTDQMIQTGSADPSQSVQAGRKGPAEESHNARFPAAQKHRTCCNEDLSSHVIGHPRGSEERAAWPYGNVATTREAAGPCVGRPRAACAAAHGKASNARLA